MSKQNELPLTELSIRELFYLGEKCTYEIPVYQRNYAWEKDEIVTLINDVKDSFSKDPKPIYYIGTLVAYNKGDRVYEIIDGQQRLTTIYLILNVLCEEVINNKLTYRARKRSDDSLKWVSNPQLNVDDKDSGIESGIKCVQDELKKIDDGFVDYFLDNVHIIRYMVPRDIDLNHYFEIMNSRGEQLEKHEIVKAQLMQKLESDKDRNAFHLIWESCCEMNVYVQQKVNNSKSVFGDDLQGFIPGDYDELRNALLDEGGDDFNLNQSVSIADIIASKTYKWDNIEENAESMDAFLPIIDFPNFLLIVLKLVRLSEPGFSPVDFNLDDKELLKEFENAKMDVDKIKVFAFTLLKARYLLDNYVVHHSKEEDTLKSNPWKLQVCSYDKGQKSHTLKNLVGDNGPQALQNKLIHLLSMFEVSFTARQRKNYLVYCLMFLLNADVNSFDSNAYGDFLEELAYRYFHGIYMSEDKLSEVNKPKPGSFDEVMIDNGRLNTSVLPRGNKYIFSDIYGDGSEITKGIPLFVFNYMDYRIWKFYDAEIRGEMQDEGSRERRAFFDTLGCNDFGLDPFRYFYFSRTRRSLEHYYPQNQATGEDGRPNQAQINCFGNFAMIGSEANSSGSDWLPHTKLDHYLDDSKKIKQVSVASLKFIIMMRMCKDKGEWLFEDIRRHQEKMLEILL